ncbi:RHS repeat-associated core domain-containing protein, partial [Alistipes putredinis]
RSFTEKVYEASPLGRVRKQALPGYMKDYEVLYTEFDYRTNDTDEVRWLAVGVDGELVCEGCHDAGTLSCTVTTDPDGHVVQSFTDGLGRTLLSRTFDDDEPIDTYSVYDDYGRLRWVVTPEGSYLLSDSQTFPVDDDFAEKYCYIYTYNDRGLMTEKRMPGREAESMFYDKNDRLVMSQDGNLRAKKQWIVYLYDAFGRIEKQLLGTKPDSTDGPIWAFENNPLFLYMTFTNDPTVPLLRSCTYDTYPSEVQAAGLDFQPIEGLTATDGESLRYDNATGSLTYEKLAVLANDTITGYHQRAYYYDYKGRLIQTVERDTEDGILCTSQRYDFVGNLIVQRESYTRAGKTDDIDRTFTYDDRSRLLSETTQVNGGEEAVVYYEYDELGRLAARRLGEGTSAIAEQSEYDIRSWLTEKSSELFDMSLGHSYTGNITSWQWQHKGDPSGDGPQNRYEFTYDGLSRLANTTQYVNGELNKQNVERFLSYDRNGNLLTMIRYENGEQSSNRRYTYTGNRLDRMEKDKVIAWDEIDSQPGGPAIVVPGAAMADNGASTLDAGISIDTSAVVHPVDPGDIIDIIKRSRYAHDRNGNLTYDMELQTDFAYNSLNLLEKAVRNDTIVAKYSYLADGTKLTGMTGDGCGFSYRGSFTYRTDESSQPDRVFESTPFGGGRIVGTVDDETEVRYFLTDHLGSVRAVVNSGCEVLERNDYYPFGKRWNSASLPISDNRDHFNGKEDQSFAGLPFSDYGARMYDRERGRWLSQDPLQQYHSPYVFCGNNPIRLIDLDGMEARDSTSVMIPPVIVYPSEDG